MENVRGVQLSQIWNRLDVEPQFEIVKKVALYQDSWAQICFFTIWEAGTINKILDSWP